ncbi:asparaginase [Alcaligenaceae bacterium B3P038]|nr:asparaginase [Alcaligenaceae bacterium B3P038]
MPDPQRKRIVLLATGGTIAGAQSTTQAGRYTAGRLSTDDLIAAVPGLAALADLTCEQVASVGSQNMTHAVWAVLAARTTALLADPDIDGVVITHGTDTLEETAYFLSLTLPWCKPVVLVGAMRPATAMSADGPANLYQAVALAATEGAARFGPVVLMNDEIHAAQGVQKMAAAGVAAFASPNSARLGVVAGTRPIWAPHVGLTLEATFGATAAQFDVRQHAPHTWPRVEVIYSHADAQGDAVDEAAARSQGLVLAGVGGGYATDAVMAGLERAVARGVAVVRATRTGSGFVARNIEVDDDAMGFMAAGWLNPAKARILLMLCLLAGQSPQAIQGAFLRA